MHGKPPLDGAISGMMAGMTAATTLACALLLLVLDSAAGDEDGTGTLCSSSVSDGNSALICPPVGFVRYDGPSKLN